MDLRDRLRAVGVTHRQVANRAGLARCSVTCQLLGLRRLAPEVRAAAEALIAAARARRLVTVGRDLTARGEVDAARTCMAAAAEEVGPRGIADLLLTTTSGEGAS